MRRLALLALLLLVASPALGQGVRFLDAEDEAEVALGETARLRWTVAAVDGKDHPLLAHVDAGDARGWELSVEPSYANVAAGATQTFVVLASPSGQADPQELQFVLRIEDPVANTTLTADGTVTAQGAGLLFGRWENPLPTPLDGVAGTFLFHVAAWLVLGLLVMLLVNPTLKLLTLRSRTTLDDEIIRIAAAPTFILIFTYGVKESLSVLPLPATALRIFAMVWTVVLVAVLVVAGYRLWHQVVLRVGRRAASRTRSTFDDRLLPVLEKTGGIVILLIGFFYLADGFGWNMAWLAAGGAIGGLVVAFAAQDTLANFFAGVHLLLDRPFKEGDDIILDTGEVCTVRRIGLRSTDLYHPANHEIIVVPNSLIAQNRIINILQPDNRYKVRIDVGVAYGTDVQQVKSILLDIAKAHPLSMDEEGQEPFVRFNAFGASSLDFSVTLWIRDVYARYAVASDIREMVEQAFAENSIEIPFPQHVVWKGRDEADRPKEPRPHRALQLHGSVESARRDIPPDAEGTTPA